MNHPNIAVIYGLEESERERFLALELVEGETLAERLRRGALPVEQALKLALQIAEALEAAHERGVVHRDLKPANIKVTPEGKVKVLDFGLAKAFGAAGRNDGLSSSPTLSLAAAEGGVVFGTAAYMAPEQARGEAVDVRADVWAFGCLLYELLTSRRAFAGATLLDTIAAVLEHEPDWSKLPGAVSGSVRWLLQRCLHKDLRQRLRDIGSVRLFVEDALNALDATSSAGDAAPARSRHTGLLWAAAAVVVVLALAAIATCQWVQPPPASSETLRLSIAAPGPISPQLSGYISPDGRHLAFVATGPSGRSMLWVRPLDSLEPRELPGTERAAHPFWSPDSRSLGFIADAKIKRVDVGGGPVQTLANASGTWRAAGAWSPDGVIVFAPRPDELAAVPAAGGPTTTVVKTDPTRGQTGLNWPDFLPDGRHFLYYVRSTDPAHRGVYVGSLDSPDTKRVLESDIRAKYAAPGYLLFLRDETLLAQPFDTERLELHGEPRAIADGIWFARGFAHASFSASRTGTLAYVNSTLFDRQLVWFDRAGRRVGNVGPVFRDATGTPQLAPDGRRVAIGRGALGFGDIWILDVALETFSRITFDSRSPGVPIWAADGRELLFRAGPRVIVRDIDDGSEETLFEGNFDYIADWSSDGRFLVLSQFADLWHVDLLGDRQPSRYLETPVNEAQVQLAPNGQWIAYTSNETGRDEVYVQSFPVAGRKRQISIDGGAMPRWRRDGGELFFVAAGQVMMAVPIRDVVSLELGPPEPLFRAPLLVQGSEAGGLPTSYDVTADGRLFLLAQPPENPAPPMTVVLNWQAILGR